MKVLTQHEKELLDLLDYLQEGFDKLPYHLKPPHGNERYEFKRRVDELKTIVSIRAMLRDGDGIGAAENNKQLPEPLKRIGQ